MEFSWGHMMCDGIVTLIANGMCAWVFLVFSVLLSKTVNNDRLNPYKQSSSGFSVISKSINSWEQKVWEPLEIRCQDILKITVK